MNSFWHSVTSNFNNREISLIIWFFIVFILTTFKEPIGFLKSSWRIVKSLFNKTIIIIQLTFWTYLIGVIFLLESLGLWNTSMIKDTLIFLLITALMLVMKIATDKNHKQSLKEIFTDAVKPIILAEFIMNLESLSLIAELILLPVMLVFYFGAYTYKHKSEQENTVKGFNILLMAISLYLLYHGIHYLYINFEILDKQQTIRDFLFPVLTTLAFLPYLYGMIQYLRWEDKKTQKRIKNIYK